MEKLDKVIAGLSGCIVGNCSNCDYGGLHCDRDRLLADALDLAEDLKILVTAMGVLERYRPVELRTCYYPLCDKHFEVRSNDSAGDCPDCGHHVVLRELEVEE